MDPLLSWKLNEDRFPNLAELAQKLIAISSTVLPAERLFSCAGLIVNKLRAALSYEHVNMLMFLCKNSFLKSARSSIPNQEQ